MSTYNINKGIGRTVEFRGLKAQYLFIFAGGLLGLLIVVMVLYMAGLQPYVCLVFGVGSASALIWKTFSMNRRYGAFGLMKRAARKKHPQYIISRKRLCKSIRLNFKNLVP